MKLDAQTISMIAQLIATVLLPLLALLARPFLKRALAIFEQKAEALATQAATQLNAEERAALYGAVKIGLRAAAAQGYTAESLKTKAVLVAAEYLESWGFPGVDAFLLADLIDAESHKQASEPQIAQLTEAIAPVPDRGLVRTMVFEAINDALTQVVQKRQAPQSPPPAPSDLPA